MAKINILGIKISQVDFKETLRIILKFINEKGAHQITTVNPELVMHAQKDKEFKNILNNADLAIPDGMGIIWASKILRKPLKERVTGTDLIYRLAELSAQKGFSIYFLGGEEGIAEKAILKLTEKHPKLKIAGRAAGSPFDPILVQRIIEAKPAILLVAFGYPKQEKWIAKYKDRLNIPVSIGVGGAFDFISGKVPRAPLWVQKVGFEWLYRLVKQPWRIKRQMALPKFTWLVLKERFRLAKFFNLC